MDSPRSAASSDEPSDDSVPESKVLVEQVLEMLRSTFANYAAQARQPTELMNAISEILADLSVFLPDFSPNGVIAKIKTFQDRSPIAISAQEQASVDRAMLEILDAVARDDSLPNSALLFKQVLDTLELCFKKYAVEARAPTTLLTSIAEILAEQSVFLPDFSPTGVITKIRSLYERPDLSPQERSALDKAMEEILDALARDEDTRLLISASNENNSLGQMVFGAKNKNEYLETIRVYMTDETSKSFMVSVADTAFELLQRVLGKIHAFMKDLSGGYALWEVPFNAPGKQSIIGIDQCPVVLKRAWARPAKIYFLTTEEAIMRFNLTQASPTTSSFGRAATLSSSNLETSLSSSLGASSSGGGHGLSSSSLGRIKAPTPRSGSPSTNVSHSDIAHSVKVSIEDGNYVNLILSRGECCESIKKRAISKLASLIDLSLTYSMWLQLSSTDSSSSSSTPPVDDRRSPSRTPTKLQKPELGLTMIPVLPDDDVGALIVKYSGSNKFLIKADVQFTPTMTPRSTGKSSTKNSDSPQTPLSAREFNKSTSAKDVLFATTADALISPRSGRTGSLISRSATAVTGDSPSKKPKRPSSLKDPHLSSSGDQPGSGKTGKSKKPSSGKNSTSHDSTEVVPLLNSSPSPAISESPNHTVFGEARAFTMIFAGDDSVGVTPSSPYLLASPHHSNMHTGAVSAEKDDGGAKRAAELIHSHGHRSNLSLQHLQLLALPVELKDMPKHPKSLDLSHNRLVNLPSWFPTAFDAIRGLNLSSNAMSSLDHLEGLKKLRTLDLSSNKLKGNVSRPIFDLTGLSRLYLNFCELERLSKSIGRLSRLKELTLTGNGLVELPSTMSKLTSLTLLDLSYNRLSDVSVPLRGVKSLVELYATSNEFSALEQFYAFPELEVLDLSCTQISSVPKGVSKLQNLVDLNLSRTAIAQESDVAVDELMQMKQLLNTRWPSSLESIAEKIEAITASTSSLTLDPQSGTPEEEKRSPVSARDRGARSRASSSSPTTSTTPIQSRTLKRVKEEGDGYADDEFRHDTDGDEPFSVASDPALVLAQQPPLTPTIVSPTGRISPSLPSPKDSATEHTAGGIPWTAETANNASSKKKANRPSSSQRLGKDGNNKDKHLSPLNLNAGESSGGSGTSSAPPSVNTSSRSHHHRAQTHSGEGDGSESSRRGSPSPGRGSNHRHASPSPPRHRHRKNSESDSSISEASTHSPGKSPVAAPTPLRGTSPPSIVAPSQAHSSKPPASPSSVVPPLAVGRASTPTEGKSSKSHHRHSLHLKDSGLSSKDSEEGSHDSRTGSGKHAGKRGSKRGDKDVSGNDSSPEPQHAHPSASESPRRRRQQHDSDNEDQEPRNTSSKRRNYGQKRFPTMGDVKKPFKSVILIESDGCEGYNVEHPRAMTSMFDLSFAPANLRIAHGLDEYFTHFYDQPHVNLLAIEKSVGVIIISLLLEKEHMRGDEVHRLLLKSQNGDSTIWIPAKLIAKPGSASTLRKKVSGRDGVAPLSSSADAVTNIASSSSASLNLSGSGSFSNSANGGANGTSTSPVGSGKKLSVSLERAMTHLVEHQSGALAFSSIKHLADPLISKDILDYESRMNYNAFKFGVLYAGMGTSEEDFYSNTNGSVEFDNFVEFLGDTIRLQGWPHFSGGLDVSGNRTGRVSVYKRWASLEIMFHISTLLPYSVDDPQQIERKKHIGNDVVVLVFQDEDAPPFSPALMKSYFNHVYLVVRPIRVSGTVKYTLATASKFGVQEHSPFLPEPAVFDLNAEFRRYLYTKLVNAERASYEAPNFAKALCRTRLQLLQEFAGIHAGNTLNKKIRLKHKAK